MQARIELGFIFASNYVNMRTKKVHQHSGLFPWVFLGTFWAEEDFWGDFSAFADFLPVIQEDQGRRLSSAVSRSSSNLRAGSATSVTGRDKELLKREGRESGIWFLRNYQVKNHVTTKIVISITFYLNINLQSQRPGKSALPWENGDF